MNNVSNNTENTGIVRAALHTLKRPTVVCFIIILKVNERAQCGSCYPIQLSSSFFLSVPLTYSKCKGIPKVEFQVAPVKNKTNQLSFFSLLSSAILLEFVYFFF